MASLMGPTVAVALAVAANSGEPRLAISATNGGGWTAAEWWFVELAPGGHLKVVVDGRETVSHVEKQQVDDLRELVETGHILDLAALYGRVPPEQSVCILRVSLGDQTHEVTVGWFDRELEDPERGEVGRALRLFDAVKELAGVGHLPDGCQQARAPFRHGPFQVAAGAGAGHAPAPDPAAIRREIEARGAQAVLKGLYSREDAWESLLTGIGSGSAAWLEVAAVLKPAADAGASYELSIAVGEALITAPEGALRALRDAFEVETVCGQIGVPPDRKEWTGLPAQVDRRIGAVESVEAVDVQAVRQACLGELRTLRSQVQSMR